MTFKIADRVKETTTTTGTGTLTLLGSVAGFQGFSTIGDGNTCPYAVVHQTSNEWEVGIGTYTAAGTTLARTTVLASSNANVAVSFSAGTKNVYVDLPADAANHRAAIQAGYVVDYGPVTSFNPANATTYYAGFFSPITTATLSKIIIPRGGTVRRSDLVLLNLGTLASSETFSVYLRVNNTTDTLLTSAAQLNAALANYVTTLALAVATGDYFEIKLVTPTWVTLPTSVVLHGSLYIE